ncbi:MAG: Na+/H+ antiporter subunit E [Chloroflexi bacterium]|nr:Na+/H+ antiporter subunit E [Chloroflexota bacterium]
MNIFLAFIWAALLGHFSPANMLTGFAIGYFVLFIARRSLPSSSYFGKVYQAIVFVLFFLMELLLANLRVAADVLTLQHHMRPRVLAFPMEARSEAEIILLSSLITLTPGTLSLDVSSNRRVLYVHVMYAADEEKAKQELRRLEKRLLDLLR